jgi:hypothetical protein
MEQRRVQTKEEKKKFKWRDEVGHSTTTGRRKDNKTEGEEREENWDTIHVS